MSTTRDTGREKHSTIISTSLSATRGLDLLALKKIFDAVDPKVMEGFVKATPKGIPARRAWYLYELLTGRSWTFQTTRAFRQLTCSIPKRISPANHASPTAPRARQPSGDRQAYCPVIRRTERLNEFTQRGLAQRAAETVGRTGAHLVARAASFLLLADSRASFEIEGERPPRNRLGTMGPAVLQAGQKQTHPR